MMAGLLQKCNLNFSNGKTQERRQKPFNLKILAKMADDLTNKLYRRLFQSILRMLMKSILAQ